MLLIVAQVGQWAADAVKGCVGEILKVTKDKITIRNAASNRKKTFDVFNALPIPPVGSFVKSVSGTWHKIIATEGRKASLAEVKVLPDTENGKDATEKTGAPMCVFCDLALRF